MRIAVPNFAPIVPSVAEICPFWVCFTHVWTTNEKYFCGLCHYAKFCGNRCSNFDNILVLIFCALS